MNRDILVRDVGPRDGLHLVVTVLPVEITPAAVIPFERSGTR